MHRLIRILALLAATCGSGAAQAQAQQLSGSLYLNLCTSAVKGMDGGQLKDEERIDSLHCTAYVAGFISAVRVIMENKAGKEVCLPEGGVQVDQVIRVFVKYMRDNPQTLHQEARRLLYAALRQTFPCQR